MKRLLSTQKKQKTSIVYYKILNVLKELHKASPHISFGKLMVTALEDEDLWGITDEAVLEALKDYLYSLDMDVFHEDSEIQDILNDGINLSSTMEDNREGFL